MKLALIEVENNGKDWSVSAFSPDGEESVALNQAEWRQRADDDPLRGYSRRFRAVRAAYAIAQECGWRVVAMAPCGEGLFLLLEKGESKAVQAGTLEVWQRKDRDACVGMAGDPSLEEVQKAVEADAANAKGRAVVLRCIDFAELLGFALDELAQRGWRVELVRSDGAGDCLSVVYRLFREG